VTNIVIVILEPLYISLCYIIQTIVKVLHNYVCILVCKFAVNNLFNLI